MNGSTTFTDEPPGGFSHKERKGLESFTAPGVPTYHPAEADPFARQMQTPGFHQSSLEQANILFVGAGGLNSWVALNMVRSGARHLIILDQDTVDRTNLHRQLYFPRDLSQEKAICLARNLVEHATNPAEIIGISLRFEEALENYALPADILVVGVDRNDCRLAAARLARRRRIPAVFTMLSKDAQRVHCFYQGPDRLDPCLWCALPNLDPNQSMACVPAMLSSCLLAAAYTSYFIMRALMGWPEGVEPFNWREADLSGCIPDRVGRIQQQANCSLCTQTG